MKKYNLFLVGMFLTVTFFACAMEVEREVSSRSMDKGYVRGKEDERINRHNALLDVVLKGIRDGDAVHENIEAIASELSEDENRVGIEVAKRLKGSKRFPAYKYLVVMSSLKPSGRCIFGKKLTKLMACNDPQWTDDEFKDMAEWVLWKNNEEPLTLDLYIDAYFRSTVLPTPELQEQELNQP